MSKMNMQTGPVHRAALAWLKKNNIDPRMVRDYEIERTYTGSMMIKVTMYMEDAEIPE